MDVRTAITGLAGTGATENARSSLDEWNRAQEAVSALLERLDHHPRVRRGGAPPAAGGRAPDRSTFDRQALGPT